MKIILAGFNCDISHLKKLQKEHDSITPETISAAYARVSRNPKSLDQLRKIALKDVSRARRSNEKIVFDMGHSSIAEHAVFNIDLIGISRLAVELIEQHRLNSYTEKSQRYIRLNRDYIIPKEIEKLGFKDRFEELVQIQFKAYEDLYKKIKQHLLKKYASTGKEKRIEHDIDGCAKEDARYVLPLATTVQLGMTINARNLEYMIRRLSETGLEETEEISRKLFSVTGDIAPSLIRYVEPQKYRVSGTEISNDIIKQPKHQQKKPYDKSGVRLVNHTENGENLVIASLLSNTGLNFTEALDITENMPVEEKKNIIKQRIKDINTWDPVPREFELAEFTFECVVSASCFAQLKRHRMATILSSGYDPALGITIPDSIREIGTEKTLREITEQAESLHSEIAEINIPPAAYVLTNAHRRRVIIKMNARGLYHFSRLREDRHAQWDIRSLAAEMLKIAAKNMPALFILACGKDSFDDLYKSIYNKD